MNVEQEYERVYTAPQLSDMLGMPYWITLALTRQFGIKCNRTHAITMRAFQAARRAWEAGQIEIDVRRRAVK